MTKPIAASLAVAIAAFLFVPTKGDQSMKRHARPHKAGSVWLARSGSG